MTTAEYIKKILVDFKPRSEKINLYNPNVGDSARRVFKVTGVNGNKVKVYAYTEKIEIEIKAATSLYFSVNLPDLICLGENPVKNNYGYKVFTNDEPQSSILSCLELINDLVQGLELKADEGMFVYRNGTQLILHKSRSLIGEIRVIQEIKNILESRFPETPDIIDPSKIPSNLQHLAPLLSEWAISDDAERNEKVSQSSKAKLKKLVNTVSPDMQAINKYLDSFKDEPLSYEATLIGNLAELVSELK
ncbi:MAG: hypothetical protein QM764_03995 [Chitinophagaceae bacterium]